jgi:alkylation response protein AidB-like acyl-CoA dehydrogenase
MDSSTDPGAALDALLGGALPGPIAEPGPMLDRAASLAAWPPWARAALGGLAADRLGVAFVAGYAAALGRLFPEAGPRACLAATESGGAHPRAIATRVDERGALHGEKTFATMAPHAERIVVVASRGVQNARNLLVAAVVSARAPGLTVTPRGPTPFAPEIPHARVALDGVVPEVILPGDGYDDYLKPFRTVEDVHVLAAACGYMIRVTRERGLGEALGARLAGLVATLAALSAAAPRSAGVHVALAGALATFHDAVARLEASWALGGGDDERARWERDRPLLLVAQGARDARERAAWLALAR